MVKKTDHQRRNPHHKNRCITFFQPCKMPMPSLRLCTILFNLLRGLFDIWTSKDLTPQTNALSSNLTFHQKGPGNPVFDFVHGKRKYNYFESIWWWNFTNWKIRKIGCRNFLKFQCRIQEKYLKWKLRQNACPLPAIRNLAQNRGPFFTILISSSFFQKKWHTFPVDGQMDRQQSHGKGELVRVECSLGHCGWFWS